MPWFIEEIYKISVFFEWIISGKHGISLVRKNFLSRVTDSVQLELMKGIKRVFDPNNILNPGKIFNLTDG